MVPEHLRKLRVSRLTPPWVPIPPLFRAGVDLGCAHNFAVSCFCVFSCLPDRRFMRSGQHDKPIPCQF